MPKTKDIMYIALFLVLVLALWAGLSFLPGPDTRQLPAGPQGGYDLTDRDFDDTVYRVSQVWDSWPERLYEPYELDGAEAPVAYESVDHSTVQYATYRMRLALTPGVAYGVSVGSPAYSMRLYIDGGEMGSVGTPGETREQTVPQERGAVYYFTPQGATTEIVVQAANFVHAQNGATAPALTIGTAESISRLDTTQKLKSGLAFGCLLTAGLYHLAIFLLNRRQVAALMFALPCLLQAFVATNFTSLLFPEADWQVAVRVEYVFFIFAAAMLVALIGKLFPGALHKWASRGYLAVCGVYIAIVLATDTMFFTRLLYGFQAVCIAMAAYVLIRLAMQLKKNKTIKSILAFLGVAIVALFSVNEVLMRNGIYILGGIPGRSFGVGEGMVFFVFCYAVLLSIEQAEVNENMRQAGQALAAAEARYETLLHEQESGRPRVQLSDFGLTKRETEVALLLLDGKSREEIAGILNISMGTVNFHCNNIYRKAGVNGLVELTRLVTANGGPGEN